MTRQDLISGTPIRRLRIYYPVSGARPRIEGRFLGVVRMPADPPLFGVVVIPTRATVLNGQEIGADSAMVIDPRCLVRDVETGEVLYNPRANLETMDDGMREWMAENPMWPVVKMAATDPPTGETP